MVGLYFIPREIKDRIQIPVYTLSAVGSMFILFKGYPFDWAGHCVIGVEGFCGPGVCSVHGDWHIAWKMPLNGLLSYPIHWLNDFDWGLHVLSYILVCFIMPIIYGSYRFVAFHYLMGPWISAVTTDDPNEFAAVWCLFSIALCVSVIKSPVRKYLHVKTWPFYSRYVTDPSTRDDPVPVVVNVSISK